MDIYDTESHHKQIQAQKQEIGLLRYVLVLSHGIFGVGRITASRIRCSLALSEISRFR